MPRGLLACGGRSLDLARVEVVSGGVGEGGERGVVQVGLNVVCRCHLQLLIHNALSVYAFNAFVDELEFE